MESNIITIRNLNIAFRDYEGVQPIVRNVDLDIHRGKVLALVGESGCGKSVTSKAIMGLLPKNSAVISEDSEIKVDNRNILKFNDKEWQDFRGKKVSIIFQDALASLNPTIKIGRQIEEKLMLCGVPGKEREQQVIGLLEDVGIDHPEERAKQYPHEISGGMRQRVMIAIALAGNPDILIADEPTTALDVTIQAQILALLKRLQKEKGISIILITHDLGIVANTAHEIAVMYAGEIVEYGSCDEVFYRPMHPYTYGLLKSVPRPDMDMKRRLFSIPGTLPSRRDMIQGCALAQRCPFEMKICSQENPGYYADGAVHKAKCWLHDNQCRLKDIPVYRARREV